MKLIIAIGALSRYRSGIRPISRAIVEATRYEKEDMPTVASGTGLRKAELEKEIPTETFLKCLIAIDEDPAKFSRQSQESMEKMRALN
jgi:hypothetical protein